MLLESILDYEWYDNYDKTPGCQKARENLREKWPKIEDDELVIINVGGYNCLAKVTNDFTPIEICEIVFPFDKERAYPMQEIEKKIYFKY